MHKINIENLEIARARKGKALKELGIDPNTLVRARKGKQLRASTVRKLADALGCDPEDIIEKEV